MTVEKISVPVIDLENYLSAEKEKLAAAITGLGCFRVINHQIPTTMMAEIRPVVRSLMEIPAEAKLCNTDILPNTGYVGPRRYSFLSTIFESFGIYDAGSAEDVLSFCSQLNVSPWQREIISTYASGLHSLIVKIASKVADCLGLVGYSFNDWSCNLRLHRYNFTNTDIGSFGADTHTDTSFVTILQEDEFVDGLQIMDNTGNFLAIDPIPGTFFVNIGDIAKVWSNGRVHNVKHRVMCTKGLQRFSVVLFMFAPKDGKVEPEAAFIDSDHPRLYGTLNYHEYKQLRQSTASLTGQLLPLLTSDQINRQD